MAQQTLPKTFPPELSSKPSLPAPMPKMTEADMMDWDDLRTSPALPAVIGAVAGAVGGVALMFLLSRVRRPKQKLPIAYDGVGNPVNVVYLPQQPQPRVLGFKMGDLVTLGTIGLALYKQISELRKQKDLETSLNTGLSPAVDSSGKLVAPKVVAPVAVPPKK